MRFSQVLGSVLLCLYAALTAGHETDQFTLPVGREFADLGPYFTERVYDDIVGAAAETNRDIERSLVNGQATPDTAQLTSGDYIARKVWANLVNTFPTNELVDGKLHSETCRANYPGLLTAYRPAAGIYDHPGMLIDVTKFVRTFFRASTVNIDGNLVGTDKLIHFINLGRIYYSNYYNAIAGGVDHDQAMADAIALSSGGNLFLSEQALLGKVVTAIYSNADLAANYAGFQFFRNLTADIAKGQKTLPAMLRREGHYWRVQEHVNPHSDFFVQFVSAHWNEALNHNQHASYVRGLLRQVVRQRCPEILDFYRDARGQRRGRQQFLAVNAQLATWFGEPYGWRDDPDNAVSVANVCFADAQTVPTSPVGGLAEAKAIDPLGRTELWWAVRDGDLDRVLDLLAQGADAGAADADGETPLHVAARWGHERIAEALLASGTEVSPVSVHRVTPLHLSIREQRLAIVRLLLNAGADVDARDVFGITPLHEAARSDDLRSMLLLTSFGADATIADDDGVTPLGIAERPGHEHAVGILAASP